MPDLPHLLAFIAAGWLLNLTPGPDVLYIVTNSLRAGVRAGIVGGLGILSGCFVHVFAAAVGVGTLLATSAAAFTVLKYAGAAYLVYIGLRMLLSRAQPSADMGLAAAAEGAAERSLRQIFLGGFWTNVLNPKVALFFLAFVPQFIAPDAEHKSLYFALLGVLFIFNSAPVVMGWAAAAGWMARRGAVRKGMHWLDRTAGVLFIGFGLRLAFTDAPGRH
ncbi:threonine/homoserine/homoserine lactone efflux protein [Variovorax sp. TBS-050B]|uniref:LysE family translocator n=1 Tax=Variovorax sp. TBS-050B TaxID=2940551 RepID=UPI0024766387|nr:LysE family translocator [Variovorax sp. TBS-050B]MDH6592596.1 threonine/homoserine/homoserine lactone efflux protein [Variovorax sp. TBS-050B]